MDILTVSSCIKQLNAILKGHHSTMWVEGEIGSLSKSPAGHWYFTLKDRESAINCAFFRYDANLCRDLARLKQGEKVKILASPTIYAARGSLQLIVKKLLLAGGQGDLAVAFEQLKQRLAKEGLFDTSTKLTIPRFPQRVGVITAPESAAAEDFFNVFKRRSLVMDVVVYPSLVQGVQAPAELRAALERAIRDGIAGKLDVIVLTRGGGSQEDLWCFNDEGLAWDIYNSPVPIVSAVGHQIDYTICDFVADLRCETPTAAAEVLTAYQVQIKEDFTQLRYRFQLLAKQLINRYRQKLLERSPQQMLSLLYQRLMEQKNRLQQLEHITDGKELLQLSDRSFHLDNLLEIIERRVRQHVTELSARNSTAYALLKAYAPQNILQRGFCYVEDFNHSVIKSRSEFQNSLQHDFKIVFYDGDVAITKQD